MQTLSSNPVHLQPIASHAQFQPVTTHSMDMQPAAHAVQAYPNIQNTIGNENPSVVYIAQPSPAKQEKRLDKIVDDWESDNE